MRKAIAAVAVLVVMAGCSSTGGSKNPKPEIQLVQTSNVPIAARDVDGMLTVHYAMRVENPTLEPITLKQVTIQSVSEGAYYVAPTSKPYNLPINAKERQDVEFWVSARAAGSVVGANGPVTLRVTCNFQNAAGETFQEIVMRRVNERAAISGVQ